MLRPPFQGAVRGAQEDRRVVEDRHAIARHDHPAGRQRWLDREGCREIRDPGRAAQQASDRPRPVALDRVGKAATAGVGDGVEESADAGVAGVDLAAGRSSITSAPRSVASAATADAWTR